MSARIDPRTAGWIGVALALGAPALVVAATHGSGGGQVSLGRELLWWGIGLLVLGWALRVERGSPGDYAVRWPVAGSWGWGLAVGLLMVVLVALCYAIVFPALGVTPESNQLAAIAARPVWVVALLAARAALVEEWLFRFYAIRRLQGLTGNAVFATLLPSVVFIVLHAGGWGWLHLLPVTLMTVAITFLYWRRRDYACCVIAHFVADFIPFALAAMRAHH